MRSFIAIIMVAAIFCGELLAGVVVEGEATGIEPVQSLTYDKDSNSFIINGGMRFASPVSREELLEAIAALRLDDRFGVSVKLNNELIVYGKLRKKDAVAKKLEATDNFFRGIVFAEMGMLKGHTLPEGYRPKSPRSRSRASVILFTLDGFAFSKSGNNYYPVSEVSKVILIPMAKYTAPDGGYLPDYDALEKGDFQPEDKENTDHINKHKQAYLQMKIVNDSVRVGQAAAFIRFLRKCGIDLDALYKSIELADGKTLQGNPVGVQKAQPVAVKPVKKESKADYAGAIDKVLTLEGEYSAKGKVRLSPMAVNDGAYVNYRLGYIKNIEGIDLSATPKDFAEAFKGYAQAWEKTVEWMQGQKIEKNRESVADFQRAHAPFRKELRDSFDKCKEIAGNYGVKVN